MLLLFVVSYAKAQRYAFINYSTEHRNQIVKGYTESELDEARRSLGFKKLDVLTSQDTVFDVRVQCDRYLNLAMIIGFNNKTELQQVLSSIQVASAVDQASNTMAPYIEAIIKDIKPDARFFILDLDTLTSLAFRRRHERQAALLESPSSVRLNLCRLAETFGLEYMVKFDNDLPHHVFRIKTSSNEFPNNEPRQYVTIYEKVNDQAPARPIWWLEKTVDQLDRGASTDGQRRFSSNQKYTVIGSNSVLEIKFDQDAIARNINFQGSISLVAHSGDKKVQVAPYYVIGQQQKALGVNAMPIKELADYFLRLMIESRRLSSLWTSLKRDSEVLKTIPQAASAILPADKTKAVNTAKAEINRLHAMNSTFIRDKELQIDENLYNTVQQVNFHLDLPILDLISDQVDPQYRALYAKPFKYRHIDSVLTLFRPKVDSLIESRLQDTFYQSYIRGNPVSVFQDKDRASFENRVISSITSEVNTIKLLHSLLKRIKESNSETINAFLSFTTLTVTDFEEMYRRSEENLGKLTETLNATPDLVANQDVLALLQESSQIFQNLANSSAMFIQTLRQNGYSHVSGDSMTDGKLRKLEHLMSDARAYDAVRDIFALHAGREIFKRLVYANIDISKANVDDGDELTISVMWYNSDGNKNGGTGVLDDGVELATATFKVRDVGWHVDVVESALLIHRIDEEKLRVDYPLSPSNFKPTAGASLLWTYYNPHRTRDRIKKVSRLVADRNEGKRKEFGFVKFLHWLEPSFGLNVSYTDFRTDRDVEFAAGPVMGFFRNSILLTSGYAFSVNGESPFYMGIGFSFSSIYEHVKKKQ
ncbi:MAG TPA: hypothetical protein VD927_00855 [Chryseosolibacter sp.]|nr:hypothetical protein [Chryseosolibacter sp.]